MKLNSNDMLESLVKISGFMGAIVFGGGVFLFEYMYLYKDPQLFESLFATHLFLLIFGFLVGVQEYLFILFGIANVNNDWSTRISVYILEIIAILIFWNWLLLPIFMVILGLVTILRSLVVHGKLP